MQGSALRIVFLGSAGALAAEPLKGLISAGRPPIAAISPRPRHLRRARPEIELLPRIESTSELPLMEQAAEPGVVSVAWRHRIPAFEVGRISDPANVRAIAAMQPDVICVSCFPEILSAELLGVPPLGCYNVHPSPLPAFRGPMPLFWIVRDGRGHGGVTVHRMESRVDAGPIVEQRRFRVPDGISGAELAQRCAAIGAQLLTNVVERLAGGRLESLDQDERTSTWFGYPADEDWTITAGRPARWAFNFIRGVAHRDRPVTIRLTRTEHVHVTSAVAFDSEARPMERLAWRDGRWSVRFKPGAVYFGPEHLQGGLPASKARVG